LEGALSWIFRTKFSFFVFLRSSPFSFSVNVFLFFYFYNKNRKFFGALLITLLKPWKKGLFS